MTFITDLIQEFRQETTVTRRYLTQVPFEQVSFSIHEKSEKLGRLAIHVAEIIAWWKSAVEQEELNFLGFEPKNISSTAALLAYFDELVAASEQALLNAETQNIDLSQPWSMTYGNDVLFTLPKKEVLRKFCMNHLIHHRAQLGVYLRILNIAVPATYGPSADDEAVSLIEPFYPSL